MLLALAVALRGGCALVVWWTVRHRRPPGRAMWLALAAGLAAYAVGDLLAAVVEHPDPGKPPAAMAAYAAGFAAFALAVALLAWRRGVWRDTGTVLDSAALLAAGCTILAQVRLWSGGTGAGAAVLPALNVAVVLLVLVVAFAVPERSPAHRLLLGAALLTIAGNLAVALGDGGALGAGAEVAWMAAAVLVALAARAPSMVTVAQPVPASDTELGRSRLAVLTVALLTTPLTLLLGEARGDSVDGRWLAATSIVTTAVVGARVWRLVAEAAAVARISRLALEGASPAELLTTAEAAPGVDDVLDLALAHARQADTLAFRASHDALTGLLNRWGFERRIHEHAGLRGVGLVVIDLDGFKQINDVLGHDAGDEVLRGVGAILVAAVRAEDVVARFGGDEFTILVPAVTAADVDELVGRLETLVRVEVEGLVVRASVGSAWSSHPLVDVRHVLRTADASMYEAKRRRDRARQ